MKQYAVLQYTLIHHPYHIFIPVALSSVHHCSSPVNHVGRDCLIRERLEDRRNPQSAEPLRYIIVIISDVIISKNVYIAGNYELYRQIATNNIIKFVPSHRHNENVAYDDILLVAI